MNTGTVSASTLKTSGGSLAPPSLILFDWHGTLVDTLDAMFAAMEEMLPLLEELDLVSRLVPEELCRSEEDAKLVRYIRIFRRLHPRILAERRVSRTEIFDAIFGADREAKRKAHRVYNVCYRNHFGDVKPFQEGIGEYLNALKTLGIKIGIATNRSREFLDHELQLIEEGEWVRCIDATICADDVAEYKPDPEMLFNIIHTLDDKPGANVWYVADSYLDMVAAKNAGVTAIFYNGVGMDETSVAELFSGDDRVHPDAVITSFDQLFDLLAVLDSEQENVFAALVARSRPPEYPAPQPPPPWIEPDWHPAVVNLTPPAVILFDWHATLVDTLDAMYRAVDEMLPELKKRGMLDRMVAPSESRTLEDAKLVEYIYTYCSLHPRVRADRKISRTDIFEVMFGNDQQAKQQAHRIFTDYYRKHFGVVNPFEPEVKNLLLALRSLNLGLGVITNRDREFFEYELAVVDGSGWSGLFDVEICGDDTELRKPHPDQLLLAAAKLGHSPTADIWYVGDSTTDVVSAKRAGMTAVFFNGAQWDLPWLRKIFPGDHNHPHKPDVVVNDFSEFWALVLNCRSRRSLTVAT
ncbi:MAG: HAD family hydrolase [Porticoccaceae bacterium]|nr:HAD family hydrolase [Porticoccaceae bacterium]